MANPCRVRPLPSDRTSGSGDLITQGEIAGGPQMPAENPFASPGSDGRGAAGASPPKFRWRVLPTALFAIFGGMITAMGEEIGVGDRGQA